MELLGEPGSIWSVGRFWKYEIIGRFWNYGSIGNVFEVWSYFLDRPIEIIAV